MVNRIKFAADYPKLQRLQRAILMHVFIVPFGTLSRQFLLYDSQQTTGKHYPFNFKPTDLVMALLFVNPDVHKQFITIRRHYARKEQYYVDNLGEWFEIKRGA